MKLTGTERLQQALWRQEQDSVFDVDKYDLEDWQMACRIVRDLDWDNRQAKREFIGDPTKDAFHSLFKPVQAFSDNKRLAPLRSLMQKAMETPNWQSLKENSTGQMAGSAIGAQYLSRHLLDTLTEEQKEQAQAAEQAQEQAEQAQEQAQSMQEFSDMLQAQADQLAQAQADQLTQAQADQLAEQAQEQAALAELAFEDFEQALKDDNARIMAEANQGVGEAADESAKAAAFIKSFSQTAGADPTRIDPSLASRAMQFLRDNPYFIEFNELLGWAKRMVRGEWRHAQKGNKNFSGFRPQALDLSKIASQEIVYSSLDNRAMRLNFLTRLSADELSHRTYDGEEKQGKGDMVIVRDESGSMHGKEHLMAIALEWALIDVCRKDKRQLVSIPFSTEHHVWHAPKPTQPDPQGLIDHLSHMYGGGTLPYPPLESALEIIERGNLQGDVLLITDGAFGQPTPDFLQRIKQLKNDNKIKIVTVIISRWSRNSHIAEIFSDKIVYVADLLKDKETLAEAIGAIV